MNPRSVSALLLSRQMPLASSTTAAYQGIVTNFANKDQYFCNKIEVSYGVSKNLRYVLTNYGTLYIIVTDTIIDIVCVAGFW